MVRVPVDFRIDAPDGELNVIVTGSSLSMVVSPYTVNDNVLLVAEPANATVPLNEPPKSRPLAPVLPQPAAGVTT